MANPYDTAKKRLMGVTLLNRSGHFTARSGMSADEYWFGRMRATVGMRVAMTQKQMSSRKGSSFCEHAKKPTEHQAFSMCSRLGWWIVLVSTGSQEVADRVFEIDQSCRAVLGRIDLGTEVDGFEFAELRCAALDAVNPAAAGSILDLAIIDRDGGMPIYQDPTDAVLWTALIAKDVVACRELWEEARLHVQMGVAAKGDASQGGGAKAALRELKQMLDEGLIDEVDFAKKKAAVLDRL